jgi:UDP-N-acetyl-D-mannosaminuronic acid dehydrogenase
LRSGYFKAFPDVQYADCFILAVPTPFKENKTADLSFVYKAGEFVAKRLMKGNLVILESTVPVGTTEQLANYLEEYSGLVAGVDFFVAHCPERVLPGKIFKELEENDRIIGGMCSRACDLARNFYARFVRGFLHITDDKTAEMVKLIENSCRDVQIAFANQVAAMCGSAGIDPFHVIELANKHPRVKILSPGCGVGGHCIAVDPYFLIQTFPKDTSLLQAARRVNDHRPEQIIEKVVQRAKQFEEHHGKNAKVLTLGIAFKPNVDDIRESPALNITTKLHAYSELFDTLVYDSNISPDVFARVGIEYQRDLFDCLKQADIIVILVKHREFEFIPREMFENKIIIDACGLLYDMYVRQSHVAVDNCKIRDLKVESITF